MSIEEQAIVKKELISDDEINELEALQSKVNTMRFELEKAKKEILRAELKAIRAELKQYKQSDEKEKRDFSSELEGSAQKKQKVNKNEDNLNNNNNNVIIINDDDAFVSVADSAGTSVDIGIGDNNSVDVNYVVDVDNNNNVSTDTNTCVDANKHSANKLNVHYKSTNIFDLETVINDINKAQSDDTIKESSASRLKVIAKLLHELQLRKLVSFFIKAKDETDAKDTTDSTKTCWEKSYPNSILGWAEMHVNDPVELKKIISDMIQQSQNQNGIWKTHRSMGINLTGPVYRLFAKIGVTPGRNTRGPKENDTGKTENFYHYKWIFIDNKSFHKNRKQLEKGYRSPSKSPLKKLKKANAIAAPKQTTAPEQAASKAESVKVKNEAVNALILLSQDSLSGSRSNSESRLNSESELSSESESSKNINTDDVKENLINRYKNCEINKNAYKRLLIILDIFNECYLNKLITFEINEINEKNSILGFSKIIIKDPIKFNFKIHEMITQNKDFAWNHKPETELKNPLKGILYLFCRIGIIAHLITIKQIQKFPSIQKNLSFKEWEFNDSIFQNKYKELAPNYFRKK